MILSRCSLFQNLIKFFFVNVVALCADEVFMSSKHRDDMSARLSCCRKNFFMIIFKEPNKRAEYIFNKVEEEERKS